MELNLKGKTALVAASSQGLGKAIAKALLQEGANVMLASRDEGKLKEVKSELENLGGEVEFIRADVTSENDIKNMVKAAAERFGGIDILVNNAGGPPSGSFETLSDEEWFQSFELNLLSYVRNIREALPYLKKNGGKIINIASSSIKEPIPGLVLSNTFRTGIVGLSKTLAQEFAPYGILVNTLAPGRIDTDRVKHLDQVNGEKAGVSPEEMKEKSEKSIPLNRYGTPEEFAKVAVFLASDANSYMTGSSFLVDGGMVKSI
ncbi:MULTISPECIES: SDR family oxidoreductase [Bacillaceae]|uniref:3-oxoacyl-ACP reductase n=2 Tax=Bacillus infantis TaxID=324767 RepID=U5L8E2_9BACI|nr:MULTISPECIES: SDR family oxidoreductase [Bacillus]OXT16510.1 3-oxoacyl-ACP reductase [Bacillus sp. OG2]AGX03633.1 3-oxoacyl-ACP reductase [Bacillus infantis NRRL B-14911]EAR65079.1 3-oxoacyl-(acyl carrier protein) reductase [Bacillus sp. NRRL B-14911]MCA1034474.1 SDR family oxidoreductase [Bacillus infantis]MCK6204079.1 SDR family oxidoreductase [Bacillus infantis]